MNRDDPSAYELDYVTANRFYVEIDSQISACFSECSGLGINIKRESHWEGGVNNQQKVILGQAEFSEVTLKRGVTNDLTFLNWIEGILTEFPKKRLNVTLLLFNQAGETMQSWTLIGSVPVNWKAPAFQADSSTVAVEELTLAYEGLTIHRRQDDTLQQQEFRPANAISRSSLGYFDSDLADVGQRYLDNANRTVDRFADLAEQGLQEVTEAKDYLENQDFNQFKQDALDQARQDVVEQTTKAAQEVADNLKNQNLI